MEYGKEVGQSKASPIRPITTLLHLFMMSQAESQKPRKTRRNRRACDQCNSRSVRCQPGNRYSSQCQNCSDYGETCTFSRPVRKRGAKPRQPEPGDGRAAAIHNSAASDGAANSQPSEHSEIVQTHCDRSSWKPSMVPHQALVMDLTEIFFGVVYPVFPLFHRPTLLRRASRGEYATDRPLFASIMAMCALTSARARDGALYTGKWDMQSLENPSSEKLFEAAAQSIPCDAPLTQEFDYMRAYAILAITAIQYGDSRKMCYYLNLYHSFVALGSLQDESNWPTGIGYVEIEERRRLFWSIYTLDIFSSIIWGGVMKSREAFASICYPSECEDEAFDDTVAPDITSPGQRPVWLQGWNFVTDLYRILEHIVDSLGQSRNSTSRTPSIQALVEQAIPSRYIVLSNIMALYEQQPAIFKTTQPLTGKLEIDLFGFQAANIAATLQLVRMVLFTTENSTVDQKCQITSEVINGFASVPVAYLRAISTPLFHHLAGIGTIMGSAFEEGLTESSYCRVRSVLLELANLLANLEAGLHCAAAASNKLRAQVSRIDDFMDIQRSLDSGRDTGGLQSWSQAENEQSYPTSTPNDQLSIPEDSQPIQFPAELFENWSWAFEFNQLN